MALKATDRASSDNELRERLWPLVSIFNAFLRCDIAEDLQANSTKWGFVTSASILGLRAVGSELLSVITHFVRRLAPSATNVKAPRRAIKSEVSAMAMRFYRIVTHSLPRGDAHLNDL